MPFDANVEGRDSGLKPEDMAEMHVINRTMQEVSDFVTNHEYEIDTTLTKKDWLNTYHQAISKQGLDMNAVI